MPGVIEGARGGAARSHRPIFLRLLLLFMMLFSGTLVFFLSPSSDR